MEIEVNRLFDNYSNLYFFEEGSPEHLIDREDFKSAMKEFANQLLEKVISNSKGFTSNSIVVTKEEIRSIINQIEF